MAHRRLSVALLTMAVLTLAGTHGFAGQPTPAGEAVIAWHVTIAPTWFDPSTAPPQITPFGMLYALHDALVRPYPGQKMGPASRNPGRRARTASPTRSSCGRE